LYPRRSHCSVLRPTSGGVVYYTRRCRATSRCHHAGDAGRRPVALYARLAAVLPKACGVLQKVSDDATKGWRSCYQHDQRRRGLSLKMDDKGLVGSRDRW
jgi:hypothetical protein